MRVHVRHQQKEVRGSTLFAVLMNWNSLYSLAVFLPAIWVNFIRKAQHETSPLSEVERIWYGAVLVLWSCCELPRLYLGVSGNREHLIAPLLMFGVLTFVIHSVIMIVFNFMTPQLNALDKGLTSVQILFGFSELALCLPLGPKMVHQNTVDFYAHLWGQEKFNQQPGDRSQYDVDDNDDDDDYYDDDDEGNGQNNNNNNVRASIRRQNRNVQQRNHHDANAPKWAARGDRGKLGQAPSFPPSYRNNKNNNNNMPGNNNYYSDSEMDSVDGNDNNNNNDGGGEQYFDRTHHRSYTPVGGSQEFLTLAPPPSALNRFSSATSGARDADATAAADPRTSSSLNSPSALLRSPSKRAASTVGLVGTYRGSGLLPPLGASSSLQNLNNNTDDGGVDTNTAATENTKSETKKKKTTKRRKSSSGSKNKHALVDEL